MELIMKKPIYNNRELVGYASSAQQAERVIRSLMPVNKPFYVSVWERSSFMSDILGLPVGFVYSLSYKF